MKSKAAAKTPRTGKSSVRMKPSTRLLKLIVTALDNKKAEDLRVLDVTKQSSITDYLVLATANSEPHLRALRIEVERVLDETGAIILGVDTTKGSGWTVVDTFEIMVHLFTAENREKYRLEVLWRDADDLEIGKLLK